MVPDAGRKIVFDRFHVMKHVNIKTVRRIMRRNSLSLPYAKHNVNAGQDLCKIAGIKLIHLI